MNSKSSFSCYAETGICSLNEAINEQAILKTNETVKPKLNVVYYYDALCGWCYGFGPDLMKLAEAFKDTITIEVISGGLFLGDRVGLIEAIAPYIKEGAYKSVESRTGIRFGDAFLKDLFDDGQIILNSLPPSIALCIVKEALPEKGLAFAELLLKAVYHDGINPITIEAYKPYVSKIGLDFDVFLTKMKAAKYKAMALNEFEIFKNSGYTGMPTLVIEKNNKQLLLTNGYMSFDVLKERLENVILIQG